MPIDYAKFDHIGSDSEDEAKPPKDDFQDIMQKCLRQLGQKEAAGADCLDPGYNFDPGDIGAPDPFTDDPMSMFGGGSGSDRSGALDFTALHEEAFQLLLTRLVCQPGASSTSRALLLEAELDLLACRYQQALVGALALKLATARADADVDTTPHGTRQLRRRQGEPPAELAAALVIEMVSAYQLGDREHAVATRDQLAGMRRDLLSTHLQKRFDGTSEILELVPQFLSLLQKAEETGAPAVEDDWR